MLTSPTSCLLAGIVGTLMTANSPDYCRTRLLSHPLGRRRLALLATLLEFGSLPLVALQPTSRHMQPADALMAGGSSADGWMGEWLCADGWVGGGWAVGWEVCGCVVEWVSGWVG